MASHRAMHWPRESRKRLYLDIASWFSSPPPRSGFVGEVVDREIENKGVWAL
jgi:hypothetical protein